MYLFYFCINNISTTSTTTIFRFNFRRIFFLMNKTLRLRRKFMVALFLIIFSVIYSRFESSIRFSMISQKKNFSNKIFVTINHSYLLQSFAGGCYKPGFLIQVTQWVQQLRKKNQFPFWLKFCVKLFSMAFLSFFKGQLFVGFLKVLSLFAGKFAFSIHLQFCEFNCEHST